MSLVAYDDSEDEQRDESDSDASDDESDDERKPTVDDDKAAATKKRPRDDDAPDKKPVAASLLPSAEALLDGGADQPPEYLRAREREVDWEAHGRSVKMRESHMGASEGLWGASSSSAAAHEDEDALIAKQKLEMSKLRRAMKDRRKEKEAEMSNVPAYERESMHGKEIAISVAPSSIPAGQRVTKSRIPGKHSRA